MSVLDCLKVAGVGVGTVFVMLGGLCLLIKLMSLFVTKVMHK